MEILIHHNYALVQGIPTKFISYFYVLYFIFYEYLKFMNGQVLISWDSFALSHRTFMDITLEMCATALGSEEAAAAARMLRGAPAQEKVRRVRMDSI
jgi:hypothetical protein